MNLFWSTRKLTSAREDHLTEFIAAAINFSTSFREAYYGLVIAGHAEKQKWGNLQIVGVQTQINFDKTTCCPDLIINLSNGKQIAIEHKLDALETVGPERDQRGQLERYLDLPIDGVAYVRTSWKPPMAKVMEHPNYIRPSGREHFLWRDFYPLMKQGEHIVIDWLREGFERLGFTPPHPSVGEMSGPDEETNRANRQNFAKLWGRTRSLAHNLGWKVGTGSIVELYLSDKQESFASEVFISPAKFDRFLFRVTPHKGKLDEIAQALNVTISNINGKTEVTEREVKRKEGKEKVVDITTSLREILGNDALQPEEIEHRLLMFTEPLLLALQA